MCGILIYNVLRYAIYYSEGIYGRKNNKSRDKISSCIQIRLSAPGSLCISFDGL